MGTEWMLAEDWGAFCKGVKRQGSDFVPEAGPRREESSNLTMLESRPSASDLLVWRVGSPEKTTLREHRVCAKSVDSCKGQLEKSLTEG